MGAWPHAALKSYSDAQGRKNKKQMKKTQLFWRTAAMQSSKVT